MTWQSKSAAVSLEDESLLIEALRRGEDAAYDLLVQKYIGRLLAVARRVLRNDEEAHDAVQDGFLQAFKAIGGFKGDSSLYTWLHRIVVNAALMRLRKKNRRDERSIEEMLPKFRDDGHRVDFGPTWDETALDQAQLHEMQTIVRELIDQLPDTHRTILVLRDLEQLDTQEVARMLDLTTSAVKVRLHRARLALRQLMLDRFAEGVM